MRGPPRRSAPSTMSEFRKIRVHETWPTPFMRGEVADFLTPSRPDPARPVRWIVVYRPAAVAVAPVTPDGELVMIHQERIGSSRIAWEFPAGQIDEPHYRDLDPDGTEAEALRRATVERELREEAGFDLPADGGLEPLGCFFPSPGFTDEVVHLYLARGVVPHPHGVDHDDGEAILDVRTIPWAALREAVADGTQQDALTLALFARIEARGLLG